jgi:hypothetical protein
MQGIKPKILFVYSDLGDGGIQSLLSVLSRELSASCDVSIALFSNRVQFDSAAQSFTLTAHFRQQHNPHEKYLFETDKAAVPDQEKQV